MPLYDILANPPDIFSLIDIFTILYLIRIHPIAGSCGNLRGDIN